MRTAFAAIHAAGVIHGDAYLSNILYRVAGNGEVEVQVIDWDTSHRLEEGGWMRAYRDRVSGNGRLEPFGVNVDDELITILANVVGTPRTAELGIETPPTADLNSAFRTLIAVHKHHANMRPSRQRNTLQ